MNNKEIKKCRICGKTLVGKKGIDRGLCSKCYRDKKKQLEVGAGAVIGVGAFVVAAAKLIYNALRKK